MEPAIARSAGARNRRDPRRAAKKLADQYPAYEPLPGLRIDGEQTSTENIADLGALATAWDAYELSLQGRPAREIEGFTPKPRRNLDAWYSAFDVRQGQKLYLAPARRVKIW